MHSTTLALAASAGVRPTGVSDPGQPGSPDVDRALRRWRLAVVLIGTVLIVGMGVAAYAILGGPGATSTRERDAAYVAALDTAGVPLGSAPAAAAAGRDVCARLDDGESVVVITAGVMTASPGMLTPYEAGFVVGEAVRVYCPDFTDRLSGTLPD